ncbi:hypothetical protein [Gemella cuniculi]|uniref:hypothetical protein n=1 Tax=Gemella cuniculi TaxID=150240 RepID=UPI000414C157|nr:hypothetical protein [Gemella cuniculi]
MKVRKILIPLAVMSAVYYCYKKSEEIEYDNSHIDKCRNNLIALGYDVKDSYTLNLKENTYLMFYFDNKGISYEVKFDKNNQQIEYIKEV